MMNLCHMSSNQWIIYLRTCITHPFQLVNTTSFALNMNNTSFKSFRRSNIIILKEKSTTLLRLFAKNSPISSKATDMLNLTMGDPLMLTSKEEIHWLTVLFQVEVATRRSRQNYHLLKVQVTRTWTWTISFILSWLILSSINFWEYSIKMKSLKLTCSPTSSFNPFLRSSTLNKVSTQGSRMIWINISPSATRKLINFCSSTLKYWPKSRQSLSSNMVNSVLTKMKKWRTLQELSKPRKLQSSLWMLTILQTF